MFVDKTYESLPSEKGTLTFISKTDKIRLEEM